MSTDTTPLSLEQAPPILVPLRFLLTAPLFGVLAALAMLWAGPDPWTNRWSPPLVAITHLLTLGVLTQVMAGALMQMLPVVAGARVRQPQLTSFAIHVPLNLGALCLAGGFLFQQPTLTRASVFLLAVALATLFISVAVSLIYAPARHPAIRAMGVAAIALGTTFVLGLLLAIEFGWGRGQTAYPLLADLHPAWGLLGWVGLLVVGVAYQVVPMFQITPTYPRTLTVWLVPVLFGGLLLWSLGQIFNDQPALILIGVVLLVGCYLAFAGVTLRLQARRRRRLPDVTLNFWRVGMASLIGAALLWPAGQLCPVPDVAQRLEIVIGVLFIVGFVLSVMNGMLYKIVPFLVWLHLQMRPMGRGKLPNMKQVIPESMSKRQFRLHVAALLLLIATAIAPTWFVHPAALVFGTSFAVLGWNLFYGWRVYRRSAAVGPATESPKA